MSAIRIEGRILHPVTGLIQLRKSRGYTQHQLGSLVAELAGSKVTKLYAQKKVSYWESGQARPNPAEMQFLARIFGVSPDTIQSLFSSLTPLSAADIFSQLADTRT